MNWKLKFTKKGIFIEFFNERKELIMKRKFLGWVPRNINSEEDLVPKFILESNEVISRDKENNIFITKQK